MRVIMSFEVKTKVLLKYVKPDRKMSSFIELIFGLYVRVIY